MCRKRYTLKSGEDITIDYEDSTGYAIAYDSKKQPIGQFIFSERDAGAKPYEYMTYLMITNMDIRPSYQGKGLGRKILEHVIECTDYPIYAGEDNGLTEEDGSHLTGGGVGFIAKMRKEGLVAPSSIY